MASKKKNKSGPAEASHSSIPETYPRTPPGEPRSRPTNKAVQGMRYGQRQRAGRSVWRRQTGLIALVALLALLPSIYFYHASRRAEQKVSDSTNSNIQTTADVVKRISRHILLPSGEQPTVATVSDASKVRSQAFFANAASGDKVLIYAQAKKAYLYRPSIDRIIEVAPLAPNESRQP